MKYPLFLFYFYLTFQALFLTFQIRTCSGMFLENNLYFLTCFLYIQSLHKVLELEIQNWKINIGSLFDYAVRGDDSMNSGERLNVGSPDGALSNSAVLSLEIKRVDVTLVDPINSPILS